MSLPEQMKAIVFYGPQDIRTETVKTPQIENVTDVILKVKYSGLCGTDLHTYRGHIKGPVGQIIGHEFMGTIVAKGSAIGDDKFQVGDDVLSTFTVQCGTCWYCVHGYSGQCEKTNTFGKVGLAGGQAEYVRIPYALSSLIKKPETTGDVDDSVYVLMADIFTTGYYGVKKIVDFSKQSPTANIKAQEIGDLTVLQLGLGPVGLCALRALKHFGFKKVVCVDNVPSRIEEAKRLGAYKTINFDTEGDALKEFIKNETQGVGFDAVLEVVGAPQALKTAYDSVRRNGFISSIGMAHDQLPFDGLECYLKNINISFGRCHAWSLFPEALEIFEELKGEFKSFIDYKPRLEDSKEAFDLFDKHKVNKVVFDLT
ncbi:sorbitol dehydrogenase [Suhomyces tanzawaensis NRRL Y-17324]|uniref:Sorbitol dehydrogenase n=1 Tax=Suhomyces tanzawaensis NRRL Y-17324 TaxID=984487 RepID=A0A1E4SGP5_9ASCO|nr:sorbitol dehydrogenase [Suhomyces tanzawaensis NRRL Y-17324]ODV78656.1 sorbitol dehydrogenase [Suhomyces tanzawaensis NRRL Y-17324]